MLSLLTLVKMRIGRAGTGRQFGAAIVHGGCRRISMKACNQEGDNVMVALDRVGKRSEGIASRDYGSWPVHEYPTGLGSASLG